MSSDKNNDKTKTNPKTKVSQNKKKSSSPAKKAKVTTPKVQKVASTKTSPKANLNPKLREEITSKKKTVPVKPPVIKEPDLTKKSKISETIELPKMKEENLNQENLLKEPEKKLDKIDIIEQEIDKVTAKEQPKTENNMSSLLIILLILFLVVLAIIFAINIVRNHKHFHNVKVEIGTSKINIETFINHHEDLSKSTSVTDLNAINLNELGTYEIILAYNNKNEKVTLNVVDTTKPTLILKALTIYNDADIPTKEDFIESVSDLSNDVITNLETNIDPTLIGSQEIEISAKDSSGNIAIEKTTLTIVEDKTGPEITGLTNLSVKKNANINYNSGVKAIDEKDGEVKFTVDTSKVDITKSGTYYATYTASDLSGNTTTARRKIVVDHSEEDTQALISKVASTLSSDPEELRDYCRNNVKYSHQNGGDDPVWYALNNFNGNCYVHALCFKALLDEKGIENQLIWVTNKSHYWNLVKINGVWRHMDSTPDRNHRKISIMTDEQRLSTLSGRKWDTSLWPAAE